MSCSAWSILWHICAIWFVASIAAAAGFHHSYRLARVRNGELWFYGVALGLIGVWIGSMVLVLIACALA